MRGSDGWSGRTISVVLLHDSVHQTIDLDDNLRDFPVIVDGPLENFT